MNIPYAIQRSKTLCLIFCFFAVTPAITQPATTLKDSIPGWLVVKNSVENLRQKYGLRPEKAVLIVDVPRQELYLVQNLRIVKTFPVSTSRYGIGGQYGSQKTPPGTHRIKEKFGAGAKMGTVFIARSRTNRVSEIYSDSTDIHEDLVTTRILWLDGLEDGVNRGGDVDSHSRLIYIHGTPEEGLIGTPQSNGCIRMKNSDVIELFDLANEGTLVEIQF